MKKSTISILVAASGLLSCVSPDKDRNPQSELSQSPLFLEQVHVNKLPYAQRMGFLLETKEAEFKGCVIYLQGLGDSIQNHAPLFNKLTGAGYRVVMFDYLGQGGSEGDMAWTRVDAKGDPFPKSMDYEIGTQAKFVWDRYSRNSDPVFGRNCSKSPRRVIGWSTGGLAAYKLAHEKWANSVALIAPGIVPNPCVGEAGKTSLPKCASRNLTLEHIITLRTLTTETYEESVNPHLDPIKPSRFLEIKEFSSNLLSTAYLNARRWKIDPEVKGVVFLSGKEDTYVNREKTRTVVQANAPHFAIFAYDGALHEIDNEIPKISEDMHARVLRFFEE